MASFNEKIIILLTITILLISTIHANTTAPKEQKKQVSTWNFGVPPKDRPEPPPNPMVWHREITSEEASEGIAFREENVEDNRLVFTWEVKAEVRSVSGTGQRPNNKRKHNNKRNRSTNTEEQRDIHEPE